MNLTSLFEALLGENHKPRDDEFVSPKIDIWFLKRTSPALEPATAPAFTIQTLQQPDVAMYKDLYKAVGGPWMWWERLAMNDDTLAALFAERKRLLILPAVNGEVAGFSELHFISDTVTEITYFGFRPEFVGKGLAKPFMEEAVRLARLGNPTDEDQSGNTKVKAIQLNTCSLDHPRARGFYNSVGFTEYNKRSGLVHIPRKLLFPELIEARM